MMFTSVFVSMVQEDIGMGYVGNVWGIPAAEAATDAGCRG